MKQYDFLGLLLIFFLLFSLIKCAENQTKRNKKNRYNKTKLNFMKRKYSKRNINKFLRKNQEEDDEEEEKTERYNTTFMPLNIYLDLNNFNNEFPTDIFGAETKDIFIKAMNRAKEILEGYLYIEIDYDFKIKYDEDYFETQYNIHYYNQSIKTSKLIPYNLFILFFFR